MATTTEKFQYTFRVDGTAFQFIQMAENEAEARQRLAEDLLDRDALFPEGPAADQRSVGDLMARLRLVNVR